MTPRLVGGVHRDVTGFFSAPPRFYLLIDRRLKSGSVDEIPVDEDDLLQLIEGAARALRQYRAAKAAG